MKSNKPKRELTLRKASVEILKIVIEKTKEEEEKIKALKKKIKKVTEEDKQTINKEIKLLEEKISKGFRAKELNPVSNKGKVLMNYKLFSEGVKQLLEKNLIKKRMVAKNEIYYSLHPKLIWQVFKIGRQNSDIINLQSFPFKDVINLSTVRGKTTIYGLPEEVFHKSDFKSRTFDYDQKETLDFVGGIKAIDVLGKYFGTPLKVKINSNKQTSEEDIVNRQVEYYLDLIKQGAKPENLFRTIITTHRNSKITFNNLGENISNYLVELKREHRRKRILESYNTKLKELSRGRLKNNLARLKKGFIGILAHTDYDQDFLKRSLFEFYGNGVGGYDRYKNLKMFESFWNFIDSLKELPENPKYETIKDTIFIGNEKVKRTRKILKTPKKISKEGEIVFNFLWDIFKENIDLYPTKTTFICRGHSQDTFPEGIPT